MSKGLGCELCVLEDVVYKYGMGYELDMYALNRTLVCSRSSYMHVKCDMIDRTDSLRVMKVPS